MGSKTIQPIDEVLHGRMEVMASRLGLNLTGGRGPRPQDVAGGRGGEVEGAGEGEGKDMAPGAEGER